METHGLISSVVVMVYWLWHLRTRRGLTGVANGERYATLLEINPKGQLS